MRFISAISLTLAVILPAACAYQGGTSTPVERNLTWYSFLNGDDIRASCPAGTGDRYRLVYNGVYIEQVRVYDIRAGSPQFPGQMETRVFGGNDVRSITFSRPRDAFTPWRGQSVVKPLTDEEVDRVADALRRDSLAQPLDGRLELASDDFYWIVAACLDGRFHFNAFRWPSPRFTALTFPDLLFAWDATEVPINRPRKVDPLRLYGAQSGQDMRNAYRFNIAAEPGGLVGQRR
jgi:hypothetical protein